MSSWQMTHNQVMTGMMMVVVVVTVIVTEFSFQMDVFTDRDVNVTQIVPQRNKNFRFTSSSSINTLETIHFIIVISLFEVNQPCP